MAEIRPFCGLRYRPGAVVLDDVLAPPWDVVSVEQQKALASRSPYNVTHLEAQDVVPEEAARRCAEWVRWGVLEEEPAEACYLLRHRFSLNGREEERVGFFALLKLEPFEDGRVIPHERVFEKFRDNRQRLISATGACFSPVFFVCRDEEDVIGKAASRAEEVFSAYLDGERLDLGRIADPSSISALRALCRSRPLIIADGHHRYQASLNAARDGTGDPWCLAYVANLLSPSLKILPTHRFVPGAARVPDVVARLEEMFEVRRYSNRGQFLGEVLGRGTHIFGVRSREGMWRLRLRSEQAVVDRAGDIHPAVKRLDTTILHNVILREYFGIEDQTFVFGQDPIELMRKNDEAGSGAVFFLNPVTVEQFCEVTLSGEVMPQKSTYFFPKVPSGLVFYRFRR